MAVITVAGTVAVAASLIHDSVTGGGRADAQLPPVCLPGLPCPVDPGDILDPVTGPIIEGLRDAAAGLLSGAWDQFAAAVAEAAVSSLDMLVRAVFGSFSPDLDTVGSAFSTTSAIGRGFYSLAFVIAVLTAMPTLRLGQLAEALKGIVYSILFISFLRPAMELLDVLGTVVAQEMMFEANAQIGVWLENAGIGLIAGVGVVSWIWLALGAGLFIFGVAGEFFLFMGATWVIVFAYVISPLVGPLFVHTWSRPMAFRFMRIILGLYLVKIMVAVSHLTVATVLGSSPDVSSDPIGAIASFAFAGIGFVAGGIGGPKLIKMMFDVDGGAMAMAERVRGAAKQAGSAPVKVGVAAAGIATGSIGGLAALRNGAAPVRSGAGAARRSNGSRQDRTPAAPKPIPAPSGAPAPSTTPPRAPGYHPAPAATPPKNVAPQADPAAAPRSAPSPAARRVTMQPDPVPASRASTAPTKRPPRERPEGGDDR